MSLKLKKCFIGKVFVQFIFERIQNYWIIKV